jgi:hypothetical protein
MKMGLMETAQLILKREPFKWCMKNGLTTNGFVPPVGDDVESKRDKRELNLDSMLSSRHIRNIILWKRKVFTLRDRDI